MSAFSYMSFSRSVHRRIAVGAVVAGLSVAAMLGACDERPISAAPVAVVGARLPPAKAVRFVRLEEVSEWSGQALEVSRADFRQVSRGRLA